MKGEAVMLKLEHVEKRLGDFCLQDISFELPKGYIMGLIGENGAGKTTLLNIILGLYQPDNGKVKLFNKEYVNAEQLIRNQISYVLTDENLFLPDISLSDNVGLFGKYYDNYEKDSLFDYCRQFSLDTGKKWKHISKGEKLKFQFAFALSHHSRLLVLDEPAANFDPAFQEQFLHMLTQFVSSGESSVILVTHQLSQLDRIADYITFLHRGKMVCSTEKETLTDSFRLVKGEEYKINLINQERIVYKEKNHYGVSALVRHCSMDSYDAALTVTIPVLEEMMYYFIKSGKLDEGSEELAEICLK